MDDNVFGVRRNRVRNRLGGNLPNIPNVIVMICALIRIPVRWSEPDAFFPLRNRANARILAHSGFRNN